MVDEQKYKKALEAFFAYPGWKEIYESAPTASSRRYKGLDYFYSVYDEEMVEDKELHDEYKNERAELEEEMGLIDWRYLYDHCGNSPFKVKCRQRIEELGGHV